MTSKKFIYDYKKAIQNSLHNRIVKKQLIFKFEKKKAESVTKNQLEMGLKQKLEEKFINVDGVAEILEIGFVCNKNVFLYGRGGHAKSEIVQEFLKYIDPENKESFIQACGEGLTEEKLFGGLNLKKFQETGEIEYLVENSFMNKKYVVFEELLDSRMNVLLSLKDILTSGNFRQGKQQFKIKTEFVICLTNRTKQEVSEDNSIKALMERFPLEFKVEWDKYTSDEYKRMFKKVLNDELSRVADVIHEINETGDFISPRTAIHMAQVYQKTKDIRILKYFGATNDVVARIDKFQKVQDDKIKLGNFIKEFNSMTQEFEECNSKERYRSYIEKLNNLKTRAQSTSYCDEVFPEYADFTGGIDQKKEELKEELFKSFEND